MPELTNILSALIPVLFIFHQYRRRQSKLPHRTSVISHTEERVLVIGATSGIGRTLATKYAARGAKVILVGRRENELASACRDCTIAAEKAGLPTPDDSNSSRIWTFTGDFTDAESMVQLRNMIQTELNGLDTMVVAAGVSAVQPLVTNVAGARRDPDTGNFTTALQPTLSGVEHARDAAARAVTVNYIGPLIAAVTFIPMLELSSKSPSILLISSLGAVVAAPTRTIYTSTKSASLLLYQSLAIEHPKIHFTNAIPSTVQGNFRANAVDSPFDATFSYQSPPAENTISQEYVSDQCIAGIDNQSRTLWLPRWTMWAHWLFWLAPGFVEHKARKKYGFL